MQNNAIKTIYIVLYTKLHYYVLSTGQHTYCILWQQFSIGNDAGQNLHNMCDLRCLSQAYRSYKVCNLKGVRMPLLQTF